MLQLWQNKERLVKANFKTIVVTFDNETMAREYVQESDWNWPLLLDENLQLYNRYSRGRASLASVAGPISIYKYLRLIFRGRKLRKAGKDLFLLGADIVVDPNGMIRFHSRSRNPHDRPSIDHVFNRLNLEND